MPSLRFARNLIELPRQLQLAYCLMRDPNVPVRLKAGFGGSVALMATPLAGFGKRLPLLRELDVLGISLVGLKLFIASCPPELVMGHQRLIEQHESSFDQDVARASATVARVLGKMPKRRGADVQAGASVDLVGSSVESHVQTETFA